MNIQQLAGAALTAFALTAAPVRAAEQVVHLPDVQSLTTLLQTSPKPVLVDFYADWCGPCKRMAPHIADLAEKRPDLVVAKIDAYALRDTMGAYRVRQYPIVKLYKGGAEVGVNIGLTDLSGLEGFVAASLGTKAAASMGIKP